MSGTALGSGALVFPFPRRSLERPEPPPEGWRHRVVGLFSGIGGLERGLHRWDHDTALLCEIDEAAREVLAQRFPGVDLHSDVRTLDHLPSGTTLIAAGFPCQDLSQAGETKGISGARSGLVEQVFRLVQKHETPWVLLENVPFMLQLSGGKAISVLASRFEQLGYKWAYRVVDAMSFGLPQRRRRVFFLASNSGDPRSVLFADEVANPDLLPNDAAGVACGFYWTEGIRGLGWAVNAIPTLKGGSTIGIPSSPAILLTDGRVVTIDIRDAERLQGFPADWTRPAEKVSRKGSRWKLVGNAVSVRAANWIGRRMLTPGSPLDVASAPLRDGNPWPTAACNVGQGRYRVFISEWPVHSKRRPLDSFLRYPLRPLSSRATEGFLKRTEQAKLRFPAGFLDALRGHLDRVSQQDTVSSLILGSHSKAG